MAADPELSKLGELLSEVGERLQRKSADAVLRAIFSTNNEIGRLSRTSGYLRNSLVELQRDVNLVTAQVKRDRFPEAREAFREVDEAYGRIGRSRGASQKEFIERGGPETD